jgi:hypothetical protein
MLAWLLESTVQLPLLPLARTVIRTAIALQHKGIGFAAVVSNWLTAGHLASSTSAACDFPGRLMVTAQLISLMVF